MSPLLHPLDFEKPLLELEGELEILKSEIANGDTGKQPIFKKLEEKYNRLRTETFSKLTAYQRVQLSRHFDRPQTLDYISNIFTHFIELHGDRNFRDDGAIVGGTARLNNKRVMVVGHQRGRTTAERLKRNFGMPNPEGYRKALRLYQLAEKFRLPLITFIDTQGAFPGLEAEERGQAEAIATNLIEMAELTVPIIGAVIGEGGSGGALALGVVDRLLILENSCYSVITPEGCAAIIFRDLTAEEQLQQIPQMAESLNLTASSLATLGVVDEVIAEPLGGAHRNPQEAADLVKASLVRHLESFIGLDVEELKETRYQKLRNIGPFISH